MFSFFQRKIYLVDYLHGFVDIHNHILPGIDDGAKNVDESIQLIKGFEQFGVTNFVCTPHIMHNYYDNTPGTIKKAYQVLDNELAKLELGTKIDIAAEHMIDENFETLLENNHVMGLRKDHLLIEMSYLQPSFNFDVAVEKVARHGFFPILAHPERYAYFNQNHGIYTELKSQGIVFQMNLLSLSEYYGKEVKKTAEKLLKNQLVEYVASDIHNMRHLNSLKEVTVSNDMLKLLLPVIENTILTFY